MKDVSRTRTRERWSGNVNERGWISCRAGEPENLLRRCHRGDAASSLTFRAGTGLNLFYIWSITSAGPGRVRYTLCILVNYATCNMLPPSVETQARGRTVLRRGWLVCRNQRAETYLQCRDIHLCSLSTWLFTYSERVWDLPHVMLVENALTVKLAKDSQSVVARSQSALRMHGLDLAMNRGSC